MVNRKHENYLARVISLGACFTTIFVVSGSVTDPVNAPKLLSLGVAASLSLGYLMTLGRQTFSEIKFLCILLLVFALSSLISVLNSDSPLTQNLYGTYGRNNGFITYLFLMVLLLSSAILSARQSFTKIITALFTAGLINVCYCLWVIVFGDFVGWYNPYGNILGTFGNPNFIGAFLGIFIAAYFAYGLSDQSSKWFKFSMLLVLPITGFEIYDSHAIQGRVVGVGGIIVVGYLYIRARLNKFYSYSYAIFALIVGALAILGALQMGPLTSIIYKTSVSLRGQYWLAGWNTGQLNPFTGAGMDALGDWYRRARDIHALELPGVNTVVNAAHNVPIDMFAFGGWPLFVSYMGIMSLGGLALIKSIRRSKKYDPILTVILVAWIGYQAQSIISINQIGLAIWGWILTGLAIAYEKMSRSEIQKTQKTNLIENSYKKENHYLKSIVTASVSGIIGLLVVLPPFIGDTKWRNAQMSRSVQNLESSLKPSYFNPSNTNKFLQNIEIFEQNNLLELSHKYALMAVKWNPESFDLWRALYLIKNSTSEEKQLAISNMKRLDPLNPNVTSE